MNSNTFYGWDSYDDNPLGGAPLNTIANQKDATWSESAEGEFKTTQMESFVSNAYDYAYPQSAPAIGCEAKALMFGEGFVSETPPGPQPYVPAGYLKMTGQHVEDGGGDIPPKKGTTPGEETTASSVGFSADTTLYLETSTDRQTWAPLTGELVDGWWISNLIELNEGDVLYVRASQSALLEDLTTVVIGCDGAVYMEGNAYALISKNSEDWTIIIHLGFYDIFSDVCGITHLPDLPATTLDDGATYSRVIEEALSYTECPVSDDGENFNFHIGVTPQDLYETGEIEEATNYAMAEYLGNTTGFSLPPIPGTWSFFSDSFYETPLDISELVSDTNGQVSGNTIAFEDMLTAYANMITDGVQSYYTRDGRIPENNNIAVITGFDDGTEIWYGWQK